MTETSRPLPALRSRHRRRLRLVPALPLLFLGLFAIAALAAPWIAPHNPVKPNLLYALQPPVWLEGGNTNYLLGTDRFGRDILTRLIYGARVSFSVVAVSLFIAVFIGVPVGILSGYVGGWVDSLIMRIVDVLLSLETMLVGLVVAIALGPSFRNLVLVIGLLLWPRIARIVRGETLTLKNQDFVRYSRTIGVRRWAIFLRHIFPNVLPALLVIMTLEIGNVILLEASLSFLGAGMPAPQASWGVMIDDGRALIATGWWVTLFPGIAITATVLSSNTFGDWLRDRLDPKTRHE
jgi:peptide/nickel transport system permease protein